MSINLDFLIQNSQKTNNPFKTTENNVFLRSLCYEFFSDTDKVASFNSHNCQLEDELSHHYNIDVFLSELNYYIMWQSLSENPQEVTNSALKRIPNLSPPMINLFSKQVEELSSWPDKAAIILLCELCGRYNPLSKIYDPYESLVLQDLEKKINSISKLRFENINFHLDSGASSGSFAYCNNVILSQVPKTINFLSRYDNWFFITNLNKKLFSEMDKNKILLLNNNYYPVDDIKKCKKIMFFSKK